MQEIKLEARPNQAFSMIINNLTYRVRIADIGDGRMVADVTINTTPVISGGRCIHGDFLLPWPSLENGGGNFMWFDDQGRNPNYVNFGANPTCRLYWIPPAELAAAYEAVQLEVEYE